MHSLLTKKKIFMNKIDKIIGEEEVMEKVIFTYQHDAKQGILIPVAEPALVEN